MGRYSVERWNKLNENLRILAQKPWNVFGGNNLYDARYMEYYTGIETQHLPSVCDYTGAEYTNEIDEYLVLRRRDRGFNKVFLDTFSNASQVVSSFEILFFFKKKELSFTLNNKRKHQTLGSVLRKHAFLLLN